MDDLIGTFDIGNERFIMCNNLMSKTSILQGMITKMVTEKPDGEKWYLLEVNALDKDGQPTWPEKYTVEYWEQKRTGLTMRSWELNYMNNPVEEGTVFKEGWIKWSKMLPLKEYDELVIYIDPAFKNNATSCYKAVVFWGKRGRDSPD